jgi:hypothetical protein
MVGAEINPYQPNIFFPILLASGIKIVVSSKGIAWLL